MSQNNMELLKWGDGTIRLAFWDAISGDDVIFALGEGGQAWRAETVYSSPTDFPGEEKLVEVNLAAELCAMVEAWEAEEEIE